MTTTKVLIAWLLNLPADSSVGIDEGGLTLACVERPEVYYEVGGLPDDE